MDYTDISAARLHDSVQDAHDAWRHYRRCSLAQRRQLLSAIALELQADSEALIAAAHQETHLTVQRLNTELGRTVFQLESYGKACAEGRWLDASIDARTNLAGVAINLRKTMQPLGVVAVFGSSNFPFAYSTAGGDTASALAAGCSVIVKAHPAHPKTSALAAAAIGRAVRSCGLPDAVFTHVYGAAFSVGEQLVKHPLIKAVGFTGSLSGGRQLFDWAAQRKEPIPVFSEMGSINPVFLLPGRLQQEPGLLADQLAASFTLGSGQFCTKPGVIIGMASEPLDAFMQQLASQVTSIDPVHLLHSGIAGAYEVKSKAALAHSAVTLLATARQAAASGQGLPTVAVTTAADWLGDPTLHQEIFGPFTLVVRCNDESEILAMAHALEGQLTCTVMATEFDLEQYRSLLELLPEKCGRFILNAVPTGVEVCKSTQHGGPYPATTDPRFGAVGEDAIKRFARPVCYQNWPDHWLPVELQDDNPLGIARTVNGALKP